MLERDGYEQFSGASSKQPVDASIKVRQQGKFAMIVRSVGSVLAGFIAVAVLSTGADLILHATGIYPPWGEPMGDAQFALATSYRSVFAAGGSFVTAQLAPLKPMHHAIALGVLGLLAALIGTIATWNGGPEYGRKWYPISLILVALPCSWVGGKLYELKMRAKEKEEMRQ